MTFRVEVGLVDGRMHAVDGVAGEVARECVRLFTTGEGSGFSLLDVASMQTWFYPLADVRSVNVVRR